MHLRFAIYTSKEELELKLWQLDKELPQKPRADTQQPKQVAPRKALSSRR
jgi:hypothetical protein